MFTFQARRAFEEFSEKKERHATALQLLAALHRDRTQLHALLPEHGRSNNAEAHLFLNSAWETVKEVRASHFLSSLDRLTDDLGKLPGAGEPGPWHSLWEKTSKLRDMYDTCLHERDAANWAKFMFAGAEVFDQYSAQVGTIENWLQLTAKDDLRIAGHVEFTIQFSERAVLSRVVERLAALSELCRLLAETFNVSEAGDLEVADAEVGSLWAKFLAHPVVVAALTVVMTHTAALVARADGIDPALSKAKMHLDLVKQLLEVKEQGARAGIDMRNFDALLEKNLHAISVELRTLAGDEVKMNDKPAGLSYVYLLDRQHELSWTPNTSASPPKQLEHRSGQPGGDRQDR